MTNIERNGLSGLCLRMAVIALAAIAFGCAPKQAPQSNAMQVAAAAAALNP